MSQVCGHCHRGFLGKYALWLVWCKVDEIYVCPRCWKKVCKSGHGEGKLNQGENLYVKSLLASIFLFIGLCIFAMGFMEVEKKERWDALETTPTNELVEGKLVRVEGEISGEPGKEALGVKLDGDGDWIWDESAVFKLADANGTVTVVVQGYDTIRDGPHPAPYTDSANDPYVYETGDEVIVIGEVDVQGNTTLINLQWLGSNDESLELHLIVKLGLWSLGLILLTVPVKALVVPALRRNYRHGKAIKGVYPKNIHETGERMDSRLNWVNTDALGPENLWDHITLASVLMAVILVLCVLTTASGVFCLGSGFYLAFILVAMIYFVSPGESQRPDKLAVTPLGLICFYNSPVVAYLREGKDFIPWSKLRSIRIDELGRGLESWTLRWKGGNKLIYYFPGKGLRTILQHWEERQAEREQEDYEEDEEEEGLVPAGGLLEELLKEEEETDFPMTIHCQHCATKIKVSNPGMFRCPACKGVDMLDVFGSFVEPWGLEEAEEEEYYLEELPELEKVFVI